MLWHTNQHVMATRSCRHARRPIQAFDFLAPVVLLRAFLPSISSPAPLSLLLDRPGPGVSAFPANIGAAERKRKAMGGPLALGDAAFSRECHGAGRGAGAAPVAELAAQLARPRAFKRCQPTGQPAL